MIPPNLKQNCAVSEIDIFLYLKYLWIKLLAVTTQADLVW